MRRCSLPAGSDMDGAEAYVPSLGRRNRAVNLGTAMTCCPTTMEADVPA